jgi:hypothetical protein
VLLCCSLVVAAGVLAVPRLQQQVWAMELAAAWLQSR